MGRNASNITILLLTVTLFSGFILVGSEARADVVDVVNITVPSSCSLSTNSGLGETYNVSMTPGQYKND
ncbi:hypothetical protein J6S37_02905, partial [Candidatus Saccharibacteria bacterium]|nr:hypothetical protein [Candidatus Saccharibacteria bacterium]